MYFNLYDSCSQHVCNALFFSSRQGQSILRSELWGVPTAYVYVRKLSLSAAFSCFVSRRMRVTCQRQAPVSRRKVCQRDFLPQEFRQAAGVCVFPRNRFAGCSLFTSAAPSGFWRFSFFGMAVCRTFCTSCFCFSSVFTSSALNGSVNGCTKHGTAILFASGVDCFAGLLRPLTQFGQGVLTALPLQTARGICSFLFVKLTVEGLRSLPPTTPTWERLPNSVGLSAPQSCKSDTGIFYRAACPQTGHTCSGRAGTPVSRPQLPCQASLIRLQTANKNWNQNGYGKTYLVQRRLLGDGKKRLKASLACLVLDLLSGILEFFRDMFCLQKNV